MHERKWKQTFIDFFCKMSTPPSKRPKTVRKEKEHCYVCQKFVANLTNHLNSHSPRSRFPFNCHYCRSMFKTEEMQSEHVQNHEDLVCPICSELLKIERYDQHMENHQREDETDIQRSVSNLSEEKKTNNVIQRIPKPTKTPNQPHSTIPDSELIFCPTCDIEWLALDEKGLQKHIEKTHQEETTPKSSKPKIKKKTRTKKDVEDSNRDLIQQNLRLTTQLE